MILKRLDSLNNVKVLTEVRISQNDAYFNILFLNDHYIQTNQDISKDFVINV